MLSFATNPIHSHKRDSSGSNPKKEGTEQNAETGNFEGYSRLSAIIKYYLQNFNFSKATYYALMEILLERVSPKSINVNPVHSPIEESSKDQKHPETERKKSEIQFQHQFKNPQILAAIFDLLGCSGNTALLQKVLRRQHSAFSYLLLMLASSRRLKTSISCLARRSRIGTYFSSKRTGHTGC